jgi:hypothetical protein
MTTSFGIYYQLGAEAAVGIHQGYGGGVVPIRDSHRQKKDHSSIDKSTKVRLSNRCRAYSSSINTKKGFVECCGVSKVSMDSYKNPDQ